MVLRTRQSPTVKRRLEAGAMLMNGVPLEQIASQLHLSMTTVRKYRELVGNGGLAALEQLSVGGRSSVLNEEALAWIVATLEGSARDHGFATDAWTSTRLGEVVSRKFGVRFSRVYMWQLATNLGMGHRLSKSKR